MLLLFIMALPEESPSLKNGCKGNLSADVAGLNFY